MASSEEVKHFYVTFSGVKLSGKIKAVFLVLQNIQDRPIRKSGGFTSALEKAV